MQIFLDFILLLPRATSSFDLTSVEFQHNFGRWWCKNLRFYYSCMGNDKHSALGRNHEYCQRCTYLNYRGTLQLILELMLLFLVGDNSPTIDEFKIFSVNISNNMKIPAE